MLRLVLVVVLILLAERLFTMRHLQDEPDEEKRTAVAREAAFLYAPLAHRLGLFPIKTELENLSFKYQHPDLYEQIQVRLQEKQQQLRRESLKLTRLVKLIFHQHSTTSSCLSPTA